MIQFGNVGLQVIHINQPYGDAAPAVPDLDMNYHRELQPQPWRDDIKPLNVMQPEGPSFSVRTGLSANLGH